MQHHEIEDRVFDFTYNQVSQTNIHDVDPITNSGRAGEHVYRAQSRKPMGHVRFDNVLTNVDRESSDDRPPVGALLLYICHLKILIKRSLIL